MSTMYRQTAAEGYMHTDKRMHTYIQLDMHTQGLNYRQTQACVYTRTDARRPRTNNILVPAQTERGDTNRQTETETERQSRRQTKREEEAKQEK